MSTKANICGVNKSRVRERETFLFIRKIENLLTKLGCNKIDTSKCIMCLMRNQLLDLFLLQIPSGLANMKSQSISTPAHLLLFLCHLNLIYLKGSFSMEQMRLNLLLQTHQVSPLKTNLTLGLESNFFSLFIAA